MHLLFVEQFEGYRKFFERTVNFNDIFRIRDLRDFLRDSGTVKKERRREEERGSEKERIIKTISIVTVLWII